MAEAVLWGWIKTHGCPRILHSDQGTEFTNNIMKDLCGKLQIGQSFSSVLHPQSNGLVERRMRIILTYLRKYLDASQFPNNWVEHLPGLEFSHNSGHHTALKFTPYLLAYARKPNLPSDLLGYPVVPSKTYSDNVFDQRLTLFRKVCEERLRHLRQGHLKNKKYFDATATDYRPSVNDVVYVRGKSGKVGQFQKFMPLFLGPFIVTRVDGYTVLIRDMHSGKLRNVNINRLKPTPFSKFHLDPSAFQEKELPVAPVLIPDRELEHVTDGSPPALDFDEDEEQ